MTTKAPQIISAAPAKAWNPVRAAASTDTGLVNAPLAINAVNLGPNRDRVLLAGQSTQSANGIYQLTESGASEVLAIDPDEVTTETVTANRLVYVEVTGTVTVTGANGSVDVDNPGFLSPLSGPTRLAITGGESGGSVTYKATVGLARTEDADANADFVSGKIADVREGTNAGVWALQGPVSATSISGAANIVFTRVTQAAVAGYQPGASLTSEAPTIKPLGFVIAFVTSLGALGSSAGALKGLI